MQFSINHQKSLTFRPDPGYSVVVFFRIYPCALMFVSSFGSISGVCCRDLLSCVPHRESLSAAVVLKTSAKGTPSPTYDDDDDEELLLIVCPRAE
jgi:hypothetical protein